MWKMFLVLLLAICASQCDSASAKNANKTKIATTAGIAKTKAAYVAQLNRKPFTNGHYVLGPTIAVNGYHSNRPTVVIVDKGSHFTHVLQLQGDKIVRVLTVSNSIGSKATPTPPGRYFVAKKLLNQAGFRQSLSILDKRLNIHM